MQYPTHPNRNYYIPHDKLPLKYQHHITKPQTPDTFIHPSYEITHNIPYSPQVRPDKINPPFMANSLIYDNKPYNPNTPTLESLLFKNKEKKIPRVSEPLLQSETEMKLKVDNSYQSQPNHLYQKKKNSQPINEVEINKSHEVNKKPNTINNIGNITDRNRRDVMRRSSIQMFHSPIHQPWDNKENKQFTVDDFEKIKELGSGKYGRVFLVRERSTNFICALKLIQKKVLKEEEITQQFIRELRIQSFLNHPNIIKMFGFFHDINNIYIILEVGTGGQLYHHLKKSQALSEPKVAYYMRQICQAVKEIHSLRIIHRDIKPQNIVLHDNVIKLCDFGWSVKQDSNLRTTFCGTPLYVCPEILKGHEYDEKIDIWSLGVMMYEMIVGENPFKITKEEQLIKIIKDEVKIPSYIHISKEVENFLHLCLRKNPDERATIRQLVQHDFFKKYPDKQSDKNKVTAF